MTLHGEVCENVGGILLVGSLHGIIEVIDRP